jgi:hypothetical protein
VFLNGARELNQKLERKAKGQTIRIQKLFINKIDIVQKKKQNKKLKKKKRRGTRRYIKHFCRL